MNFPKGWTAKESLEGLKLSIADKWMLSKLSQIVDKTNEHLEKYEFGEFASKIYEFWYEFCSVYIEVSKISLSKDSDEESQEAARNVLF